MKTGLKYVLTAAVIATVAALLVAECAVAEDLAAAPSTGELVEAGRLTHVFHHICENPRLGAVLKRHRVGDTNDAKSAGRTVCAIGDFAFQRAEIYFELYPAPGADEIWIADESKPLAPNAVPKILLRLRRAEDTLLVSQDGASPVRLPRERGYEDRILIVVSDGKMTVRDVRPGGRQVLGEALAVHRGVQLLVPSEGDSCGPEYCGLPALDVYLDAAGTDQWTKVGLMRTDEPSK